MARAVEGTVGAFDCLPLSNEVHLEVVVDTTTPCRERLDLVVVFVLEGPFLFLIVMGGRTPCL